MKRLQLTIIVTAVFLLLTKALIANAATVIASSEGLGAPVADVEDPIKVRIPGVALGDLTLGEFGAFAQAIDGSPFTSTHTTRVQTGPGGVVVTNISGKTIVFQEGWMKARIVGDINISPALPAGALASSVVSAELYVSGSGPARVARGQLVSSVAGLGGPMTTNIFSDEFIVNEESGGATIQLNSTHNSSQFFPSGQSHLDVEFVMPAITLQPDVLFGWDFLLTLNVRSDVGSSAEADFLNTASISVVLPSGFEDALSLDGVNPASVAWITTDAPPPDPDPDLSEDELLVILMMLLGNSYEEEETVPE